MEPEAPPNVSCGLITDSSRHQHLGSYKILHDLQWQQPNLRRLGAIILNCPRFCIYSVSVPALQPQCQHWVLQAGHARNVCAILRVVGTAGRACTILSCCFLSLGCWWRRAECQVAQGSGKGRGGMRKVFQGRGRGGTGGRAGGGGPGAEASSSESNFLCQGQSRTQASPAWVNDLVGKVSISHYVTVIMTNYGLITVEIMCSIWPTKYENKWTRCHRGTLILRS